MVYWGTFWSLLEYPEIASFNWVLKFKPYWTLDLSKLEIKAIGGVAVRGYRGQKGRSEEIEIEDISFNLIPEMKDFWM